ncbi:hypothetical protein L226DRAFT_368698 [Lentinus tigrinus ALCF2SS1-7]|uniref:uncharacterized protein n=1 Tax=Lentinus tigrinus ALCF2SS1-7 TaxID=1328758 RepID=UPI001165E82B|nr:hypothetical protein L226DRAFT_368698 [Lentinus tigrinus ALCF2SS1-7]
MCTSSRTCCITDSETRTIAHLCISIAIPSLVALSSSASSRRHPVLCIFFVDTLLTLERRPQGPDPFHYTNQGGLGPSVPLQTCWTCKRPAGACRSGEWCPMVRKQHSDRRIYPTGAAASCEALLEPGAIDMTVHVGGRTAQSASVRRAWRDRLEFQELINFHKGRGVLSR